MYVDFDEFSLSQTWQSVTLLKVIRCSQPLSWDEHRSSKDNGWSRAYAITTKSTGLSFCNQLSSSYTCIRTLSLDLPESWTGHLTECKQHLIISIFFPFVVHPLSLWLFEGGLNYRCTIFLYSFSRRRSSRFKPGALHNLIPTYARNWPGVVEGVAWQIAYPWNRKTSSSLSLQLHCGFFLFSQYRNLNSMLRVLWRLNLFQTTRSRGHLDIRRLRKLHLVWWSDNILNRHSCAQEHWHLRW